MFQSKIFPTKDSRTKKPPLSVSKLAQKEPKYNVHQYMNSREKNQQRCCVQSINVEDCKGISGFPFCCYIPTIRLSRMRTVTQFIIQPKVSDDILSLNR